MPPGRRTAPEEEVIRLAQLQLADAFDEADPGFLHQTLQHFLRVSEASLKGKGREVSPSNHVADLVARVTEKLLEVNHDEYPRMVFRPVKSTVAEGKRKEDRLGKGLVEMAEVRRAWASARRGSENASSGSLTKDVKVEREADETLARNLALVRLHVMFPNTPITRLREVLLSFPHSFLLKGVEQLLKDTREEEKKRGVKTFLWFPISKPSSSKPPPRPGAITLTPDDLLRSPDYLAALAAHLRQSYPAVPPSAARSLALEGGSLAATRELFQNYKSTQSRFSSWLSGVTGSSSASSLPLTQSDELDAEIYAFEATTRAAREQEDAGLARELNARWTEPRLLHSCGCCFDDVPFEDIGTCSTGEHEFCITCIARQVEEHVFGGAPLSPPPMDRRLDRTGVRCLSTEGCHAPFSHAELERVLPPTLSATLARRVADAALEDMLTDQGRQGQSKDTVVRCPFCAYCELEDSRVLSRAFPILTPGNDGFMNVCWTVYSLAALAVFVPLYLIVFLCICLSPPTFSEFILSSNSAPTSASDDLTVLLVFPLLEPHRIFAMTHRFITSCAKQLLAIRSGQRNVFQCRNGPQGLPLPEFGSQAPAASSHGDLVTLVWGSRSYGQPDDKAGLPGSCGKLSCLTCQKVYVPGSHKCYEEQDGLRLAIEKAMSDAVKRTCPACGVAFQKSSGCNRIACRCGFVQCYICRKQITEQEGYGHFCNHFREILGASCTQCERCSLWQTEDEKHSIAEAAAQARKKWLRDHPELAQTAVPLRQIGPEDATTMQQVRQSLASFCEFALDLVLL